MTSSILKRLAILGAVLSCSIVVSTPLSATNRYHHQAQVVDCNYQYSSVQRAIDRARHYRNSKIIIIGHCDESVTITRDDITLSGDLDNIGVINGGLREITINGAKRVNIEFLEITGSGYGVLVHEGASANIRNNNIHDNEFDGVGVFTNAYARIEFNTISTNGRPSPFFEAGIDVGVGSTVRSRGNYISDNGYAAVEVGNMAYFRSGPPAGTDTGPDDRDTFIQKGCDVGSDPTSCGAQGTIAIDCFRSGTCDFRDTEVIGSSFISGLSVLDVRNSTINGDVGGSGGSLLRIRGSVSGSGTVNCFSESIAQGVPCGSQIP